MDKGHGGRPLQGARTNVTPAVQLRPLILNVDDDTANRSATSEYLRGSEIEVIEAADGTAALSLIASRQPSLVLLDLDRQGTTGRELCQRIKSEWPETIVVQIATAPFTGLELGADCILVAPVEPVELITVSRAMLRLHQAEAQVRQGGENKARDAPLALSADLEDRVSERTRALADANQKLRAEIEEREQIGEQIRQVQKMEALGQLTGGIAHDFNNLLTAILGGLEVTRRRIDDPRTVRLIDSSISASKRGAKLIAQLLAFAQKQNLREAYLPLSALVRDMRELLEQSVGVSVQLVLELDDDAWPVMADANQMQTALLNLAINARDAMPNGGTLRIGGSNATVQTAETDLPAGEYTALSVQDDGTGMAEEVQKRLFEPFFTTKEVGKGTGMGLAQVYGFVRQSGGTVRMHSVLGQGTTFTILLPRAVSTDAPGTS